MHQFFRVLTKGSLAVGMCLALASCGIFPSSGPGKSAIRASSVDRQGTAFVVEVDNYVARASNFASRSGFGTEFLNARAVRTDSIRPGDVLVLTVYENVEAGVLGTAGVPSNIEEVQVDSSGFIFVPYAGRIKASGRSTDSLRRILTNALASQTPDPQVIVRLGAGEGSSVSVIGTAAQGNYPVSQATKHLSGMIAAAGGVATEPERTRVTVVRGTRRGSIFLSDLYSSTEQDVHMRPGDRVIVQEDKRRFSVMGALNGQGLVEFPKPRMSAIDAIAYAGGLSSASSDPTGIFVLRDEAPTVANSVLRRGDIGQNVRMAYVLNLTRVDGMFQARDFQIRDGDTLYVTEAPYYQFSKILSSLLTPIAQANSVTTALGQ